jgi:hypothetical protein
VPVERGYDPGYLAILTVDTADKNAAAAERAANRLTLATWGLVAVTIVLVVVTIVAA